jgi:hypothetical protein
MFPECIMKNRENFFFFLPSLIVILFSFTILWFAGLTH